MTVAKFPDEETVRQATWDASVCGRCGKALAADEPVGMLTGNPDRPRCPNCVPCYSASWERRYEIHRHPERTRPCRVCGRQVTFMVYGTLWPHTYCCEAHRRLGHSRDNAAGRKARRAEDRGVVQCAGCGKPFSPKRKDARCCSATCRQRVHRQACHASDQEGNITT